ncbi:unnamed protein product [marine sediment metagenome]|uniref:Uncharacterized protein n=1 Tax=marine sediment metagenome TaxID=412755 RepID=X1RB03_9ZZZZ
MTHSATVPLQPYKKAVFTNRPNLSELKTGLHDLAAKNERKADFARFWLTSLTIPLKIW